MIEESEKDPVSVNSSDFYEKNSPVFNSKVSGIGNEWHLDIGIDQSWGYYEIPSQTRENNSDQESLADFEGFRAAKKRSFGQKQTAD